MTDYYQYTNLKNISEKFKNEFQQLINELIEEYGSGKIKHRTLALDMNGSFNKPEVLFEVPELDFDTRDKIDRKIKNLFNKHGINFNFNTAG